MKKFLVFLLLFIATPALIQTAQRGQGWQMGTVTVPKCLSCSKVFQNIDQYTLHQLDTGHGVDTTAGRQPRRRKPTQVAQEAQEQDQDFQTVPGSHRVKSTKRKDKTTNSLFKEGRRPKKERDELIRKQKLKEQYQREQAARQARGEEEEGILDQAGDLLGGMLEGIGGLVGGTFDAVENLFDNDSVASSPAPSSNASGSSDQTSTSPDSIDPLLQDLLLNDPTQELQATIGFDLEPWQIEQMQMGLPIDTYISPEQRQLYLSALAPFDPNAAVQEQDILFTPEEQAALDAALYQDDSVASADDLLDWHLCPHCASAPMHQADLTQHMQQAHGQ